MPAVLRHWQNQVRRAPEPTPPRGAFSCQPPVSLSKALRPRRLSTRTRRSCSSPLRSESRRRRICRLGDTPIRVSQLRRA